MYKFKQKNERDYQLPFITFCPYPKLKEKNEKTKINFRSVIFRLFSKVKL